ncbi:hypothetical protein K1T35_48610 (plasmid) [Pseudonocardia sp. DSM 110487]|uniref:hypothetical protein n=1 Tax=Pseudonocardia sp. DSM 110487 TaxID=2865833 RepID=UPI001C6953E2|nr:hypothetical protein [Pseudonocardia sp. DSM 110487]QYN40974.1 hypothetical protein K1T35_47390 [Pseudonocardia sp. DSM 110487]QYN41211.1 hypothetical protein K1T35_48610 [Pseudonocardia sp. DSM 110487]
MSVAVEVPAVEVPADGVGAAGDPLGELRARLYRIAVEEADSDPVAAFFDAAPLDPGFGRRVVALRERRRREAAHDETGGLGEDEERARSEFPR